MFSLRGKDIPVYDARSWSRPSWLCIFFAVGCIGSFWTGSELKGPRYDFPHPPGTLTRTGRPTAKPLLESLEAEAHPLFTFEYL